MVWQLYHVSQSGQDSRLSSMSKLSQEKARKELEYNSVLKQKLASGDVTIMNRDTLVARVPSVVVHVTMPE